MKKRHLRENYTETPATKFIVAAENWMHSAYTKQHQVHAPSMDEINSHTVAMEPLHGHKKKVVAHCEEYLDRLAALLNVKLKII